MSTIAVSRTVETRYTRDFSSRDVMDLLVQALKCEVGVASFKGASMSTGPDERIPAIFSVTVVVETSE